MKIGITSDTRLADRPVRRSPTGRSGPGCCACRAWRTSPSGASGSKQMQVHVDPERLRGNSALVVNVMDATAEALDAGILQCSHGVQDRHRRVRRDAEPAAQHPARLADRRARRTSPGCPIYEAERRARSARRRRRRGLGPPAAHRRRRHQRRSRADDHRREAPLGEHPRRHAGRRGGDRGAAARSARASRSTPPSSGLRRSSSCRSTT